MPILPNRELLEDPQEKNLTMNYAWNLSNDDVSIGNFAYFIRFLKKKSAAYPFNLIPSKIQITIPEIQIKLLHFMLNISFSS